MEKTQNGKGVIFWGFFDSFFILKNTFYLGLNVPRLKSFFTWRIDLRIFSLVVKKNPKISVQKIVISFGEDWAHHFTFLVERN